MRTVAMYLAANPAESKVMIDNVDVSDMCTGVEVEAHIGQPTQITLFLIANCQLLADVPDSAVQAEQADGDETC